MSSSNSNHSNIISRPKRKFYAAEFLRITIIMELPILSAGKRNRGLLILWPSSVSEEVSGFESVCEFLWPNPSEQHLNLDMEFWNDDYISSRGSKTRSRSTQGKDSTWVFGPFSNVLRPIKLPNNFMKPGSQLMLFWKKISYKCWEENFNISNIEPEKWL